MFEDRKNTFMWPSRRATAHFHVRLVCSLINFSGISHVYSLSLDSSPAHGNGGAVRRATERAASVLSWVQRLPFHSPQPVFDRHLVQGSTLHRCTHRCICATRRSLLLIHKQSSNTTKHSTTNTQQRTTTAITLPATAPLNSIQTKCDRPAATCTLRIQ